MRPEKLSTQQSLMQLPVCRVSSRQPGQWPQTPSDKSKWCRVILLFSFFGCKSYDILIWVIFQNFALGHCHLESWTIQTIEFRSVMAMRFMTLGLLPRVPESTLVGACVNYCVCRQWSNQEQLDHRFGGIAHNNFLWGSYPPQRVMLVQHGFAACDVDSFLFLCDLAPCAGMVSQA